MNVQDCVRQRTFSDPREHYFTGFFKNNTHLVFCSSGQNSGSMDMGVLDDIGDMLEMITVKNIDLARFRSSITEVETRPQFVEVTDGG